MDFGQVTYPIEEEISENVVALVGFRDDRVSILVNTRLPLVKWVTIKLDRDAQGNVEKTLDRQRKWRKKSTDEKKDCEPAEVIINDRLKARLGFADDHVEIIYNTKVPLVGWYPLTLGVEDQEAVERVLGRQKEWLEKPDFFRKHGGAE